MLSPAGSTNSSTTSQHNVKTPSEHCTPTGTIELTKFQQAQQMFSNNNNNDVSSNNHQISKNNIKTQSVENNNNPNSDSENMNDDLTPTVEVKDIQIDNDQTKQQYDPHQNVLLQQHRNRLGLMLPITVEMPSPGSDTTPTQTTIQSRSNQGSPFYAEPADALGNVIRRSQRINPIPQSQRHSEPPKGPLRSQFCQVLSPIESEKSHISGSLDELKTKHRRARGRLDPWPVDSSWEFMGNDDDQNDYDTDANWNKKSSSEAIKASAQTTLNSKVYQMQSKRLTVNEIISKRLPELKIPEMMQRTTFPATHSPEMQRNDMNSKGSRMSAYDNVEKSHSGYATTSLICHDSAQSDDGTVFSEPWDSSQWDSFWPHDGNLF